MYTQSICKTHRDICKINNLTQQLENTTDVEVVVDAFGNLSIEDPSNHLEPSLVGGNFSGTGSKASNFYVDLFGNLQYTP